jgi:hypothetical protein
VKLPAVTVATIVITAPGVAGLGETASAVVLDVNAGEMTPGVFEEAPPQPASRVSTANVRIELVKRRQDIETQHLLEFFRVST